MAGSSPQVGDTFRVQWQDSYLLHQIIEITENRITAVIVDEPVEINGATYSSERAGEHVGFLPEEAATRVAQAKMWDRLVASRENENRDFWTNRRVGEILHYKHGPDLWIRGEVIADEDGRRSMLPAALLGTLSAADRPRRTRTGEPLHSYVARQVLDGVVFRPSPSALLEGSAPAAVDPRTLPEIDLALPEPTEAEEEQYAAGRLLEAVRAVLNDGSPQTVQLDQVRALVQPIGD